MSLQRQVTFGPETWSKGTRGTIGAHATDRPGLLDVRMYQDGSLGPRPRWAAQGTVTMALSERPFEDFSRVWPVRNGLMIGGTHWIEEWDLTGTRVRRGNTPGTVNDSDLYGPVNQLDDITYLVGTVLVVSQPGGSVFAWPDGFSGVPMTVTHVKPALDTRFGSNLVSRGSVVHQGRAFYWGFDFTGVPGFGAQNTNRFWYSDPYALGTFTSATQFFDIDGEIAGAISLGSNLLIWSTAGEWYALQGRGDPAESTLQRIGPGRIPSAGRWPVRVDNTGIFLSADGTTLVTIGADGRLNDTDLNNLGAYRKPTFFTSNGAADGPIDAGADSIVNSVIVPLPGGRAFCNHNRVWTEESWPFETSNTGKFGGDCEYVFTSPDSATEVFISDDLEVGWDWLLYTRPSGIDEPESGAAFETVSPRLVLPRITEPGSEVMVQRVVVEVRTYDDTDPAPSLTVSAVDGDNNAITMVTGPDSLPFAGVQPGVEQSWQFVATPQPPAFTHFTDITIDFNGLVIERVYVEYQLHQPPVL